MGAPKSGTFLVAESFTEICMRIAE